MPLKSKNSHKNDKISVCPACYLTFNENKQQKNTPGAKHLHTKIYNIALLYVCTTQLTALEKYSSKSALLQNDIRLLFPGNDLLSYFDAFTLFLCMNTFT
jgi:hypothetical protein